MDPARLTRQIKTEAQRLGFDAVGVAPAAAIAPDRLMEWLMRGYHGEMAYLERHPEKRLNPSLVLTDARSVVSVALNYHHSHPLPYDDPDRGAVSRYAFGDDYHDVMGEKLRRLLESVLHAAPGASGKAYVDTGPVLDKHWAARSGVGWLGKNGNLLAKRRIGSWFFIGELLLDVELEYDRPHADHCGSCTRCLDACPTEAIVQPYVVDGRRCISYLTIELRGDIPTEYRKPMKNLIFGCDICQDVCPWNRKVEDSAEEAFRPRPVNRAPSLRDLARMTPEDFRREFRRSPVKRTKWRGLMRNVAVALGNSQNRGAVPELAGLLDSDDPMVRRHAAWALGQVGGADARQALERRRTTEADPHTRAEIELALGEADLSEPRGTGGATA